MKKKKHMPSLGEELGIDKMGESQIFTFLADLFSNPLDLQGVDEKDRLEMVEGLRKKAQESKK